MTGVRSLSSKGQVVVPKEIREYLKVCDGDQLRFSVNSDGEVVLSAIKQPDLMELFGSLPPQGKTESDFEKILKESKEERMEKRVEEDKI